MKASVDQSKITIDLGLGLKKKLLKYCTSRHQNLSQVVRFLIEVATDKQQGERKV